MFPGGLRVCMTPTPTAWPVSHPASATLGRHRLLEFDHRLLTDSQYPLARAVQVRDQPDDRCKRDCDHEYGRRSGRPGQPAMIAHRAERQKRDAKEYDPNGHRD